MASLHYMKASDPVSLQNKAKQQKERLVDDALTIKAPRSFILPHGVVDSKLGKLVHDLRSIMEPYTAANLEVSKQNKLKDFLSMAGFFHVTHMVTLSESALDVPYLRMCRLPRGPTLSFKIHSFTLMKDVAKMFKKAPTESRPNLTPPLVILNGFPTGEPHVQLMTTMFQNMFPTISVKTINLKECKRVVMFDYNKETKLVQMRHYRINLTKAGVSKAIRKITKKKVTTSLRNFSSAADFIAKDGAGAVSSDSELDEAGISTVVPQTISTTIAENSSVNVRLQEIGPRIDMELFKIQDDFFEGKTIYHAYSTRTPQEEAQLAHKRQQAKALKQKRKAQQEGNVRAKMEKKESENTEDNVMADEMDDVDYYREAVGEEPDDEFVRTVTRTPSSTTTKPKTKKDKKHSSKPHKEEPKKKRIKRE